VAPGDIEGTAEALWHALTMPDEEKQLRARRLRRAIEKNDLRTWLQRQSDDLSELASERLSLPPVRREVARAASG
jgi:trehalose 6-phosphate synthase